MDLELLDIPFDHPGFQKFFGAWTVRGALTFLVDTGPSVSADSLIQKLRTSGVNRVDYVLITHIHLDHAGGLSRVLDEFPGARVVCHRKALPHLVDPARLWKGSREVLGDMADAFGPLTPVPEDFLIPHDEASIPGLRLIETPGHAPHHVSFSYQGCLFAGEAAGNYIGFEGRELLRPATPSRFYLEESLASVDRMRDLEEHILCYAHFGWVDDSRRMLGRFREQLIRWREILASLLQERPEADAEVCLETLLEADPELGSYSSLDPDIRERERYFILNSIHGYLGYLKRAGI